MALTRDLAFRAFLTLERLVFFVWVLAVCRHAVGECPMSKSMSRRHVPPRFPAVWIENLDITYLFSVLVSVFLLDFHIVRNWPWLRINKCFNRRWLVQVNAGECWMICITECSYLLVKMFLSHSLTAWHCYYSLLLPLKCGGCQLTVLQATAS